MRLPVFMTVLCCVFLFVTGCSCEEQTQARGAAPPAGEDLPAPGGEALPSLGSLRTREATIRIEAGPRFSVFGSDGSPVALSLSKAAFRRELPALYEAYENAVAGRDSGGAEEVPARASGSRASGGLDPAVIRSAVAAGAGNRRSSGPPR